MKHMKFFWLKSRMPRNKKGGAQMAVVHIFKENRTKDKLKNVYVPKEKTEQINFIMTRKGKKKQNESQGTD